MISGLTLEASCVVLPVHTSGPVRLPLRPSPVDLYLSLSWTGYSPRKGEDRAGLRFYVLFLSPHAAVLTPAPRSLRVPTASRSALAFAQVVGVRRVARSQPGSSLVPDSPSNTYRGLTFTELQRSLNTTACGFGRPHGLGRTTSSNCMPAALRGNRVGASSATLLPTRRALYLFSQVG